LKDWLHEFHAAGKLILGICNGFQILIKSGILLSLADDFTAPATLTWNDSGKFEDRWVPLVTSGADRCVFFRGIERMYLPSAHAEGKFVPESAGVLKALEENGQLVLRYGTSVTSPARMQPAVAYPENP